MHVFRCRAVDLARDFRVEYDDGDARGDCLDRWLRFEGRNDPDIAHFQDAYKDIMCPPDLSWRRMVLAEGPAIMDKLIAGVAGW